jgi:hypothetical protein
VASGLATTVFKVLAGLESWLLAVVDWVPAYIVTRAQKDMKLTIGLSLLISPYKIGPL